MFDTLAKAGKYLGQAAKLMVGVPDYDNYVQHIRLNHPDQTPRTPGCSLRRERRSPLLLRI